MSALERAEQGDAPAGGVRPGAFSALLRELAGAPAERASWSGALRPGAAVGRFELVRELGRGGFGAVWEARDRALGRPVAFKALEAGAPDVDDRALREAEAAALLSHPNVVTVFDVGRCEHGAYLVLELLRGETLAARLARGPLPAGEALHVGIEVARALAHAHARGVVHRDLTPANVHLGQDGRVKVLDFGMARAFGRRQLDGGTPGYMAPEQRRGAPEDERADVYALGALLHHLLTGRLPGAPSPPLATPEHPALGPLVARMLREDPVERPRDAGEALAALAPLEGATPAPARPPPSAPSAPRSPAERPGRPRRQRRAAGLAVLAGVAAAVAVAGAVAHRRASAPAGPPSVAVLPFTDLSPERDQAYFADGLAEQIIDALAHVDGLRVSGRTSSFAFRAGDPRAAGKALGVGAVLEGSVRKAGDRVRITADLVSLADGYHLWSETYDRRLVDVFAVQDDIARAVTAALATKLLPRAAPGSARRTADPEAYREYLLGRQLYARLTPENGRKAAAAFRRALERDPSYAPAWASLAVQLSNLSEEGAPDDGARLRQEALQAAERAVALDPELAEGYSARAILRAAERWDWGGALADMERAVALAPGDAHIRRRQAILLSELGRVDEGIAAMRQAVEADPAFASNWLNLGELQLVTGDLAAARQSLARVAELAPDADLHKMLGMAAILQQDAAGAGAEFARAGLEQDRLWGEAVARAAAGDDAGSRRALAGFTARYGAGDPTSVASAHAYRGEVDAALGWLERALAQRDHHLVEVRAFERLFPAVREAPRYRAVLRAMHMPDA